MLKVQHPLEQNQCRTQMISSLKNQQQERETA